MTVDNIFSDETDEETYKRRCAQKELDMLKGNCDLSYKFYQESREHMLECRKVWEGDRLEYEDADRKLAMSDGRYQVIKAGQGKKPAGTIILTPQQIQDIADRLGVKIELPD